MSSKTFVLVVLTMNLAACGWLTPNETTPEDDELHVTEVVQTQVCADYLACMGEVSPATVGPLVSSYGEAGDCWNTEADAELCDDACEDALRDLHWQFPDESACRLSDDDGLDIDGDWEFEVTCGETTGSPIAVSIVSEGNEFTIEADSTLHFCDRFMQEFSCISEEPLPQGPYSVLTGTFADDGKSLVGTSGYDIDGVDPCDLSGTRL